MRRFGVSLASDGLQGNVGPKTFLDATSAYYNLSISSALGSRPVKNLDTRHGVLLSSPQSRFGSKVYFCREGRRHWVMDAAWLAENGFRWPDDVIEVPAGVLEAFRPAGQAPRQWSTTLSPTSPGQSSIELRQRLVAALNGSGIEIGAGANPMPLPIHCDVRFVDYFDRDGLLEHAYDGQHEGDLVTPDFVGTFEDLSRIQDGSIDFVVACHVIEHTRDPIGAIVGAYRKLKPGGTIALVIPDMTRTFDRKRKLTPLGHLIEDYQAPNRERDITHFKEFYAVAQPVEQSDYERTWREKWEEAYPIHYHTWTYESFSEMIEWVEDNVVKFSSVWRHPAINNDECIEFYFSMTK
jgi:SAM-dependent methyltransferase